MRKLANEVWDSSQSENKKFEKPTPIDREIKIPEGVVLFSITDPKGNIKYCNENFVDISGYEEYELAGRSHNIVRHPDMPRVIFKIMWERLLKKEPMIAVVKNLAKSGKYYWIVTEFTIDTDAKGNIIKFKARRKAAPKKAVEVMAPMYKKLLEIERTAGMGFSEDFLEGFLDGKGISYDDFMINLIGGESEKGTNEKDKKSFFGRFFGS